MKICLTFDRQKSCSQTRQCIQVLRAVHTKNDYYNNSLKYAILKVVVTQVDG